MKGSSIFAVSFSTAFCLFGIYPIFVLNLQQDHLTKAMSHEMSKISSIHSTSLQDVAVNAKMKSCIKKQIQLTPFSLSLKNDNTVSNIADKAELFCTGELINSISLNDQTKGSALTYLLLQDGYKVDSKQAKFAKNNPIALASVEIK